MATVPEQGTVQFDQAQIVRGLLIIAHQDGSTLRQPSQGSFYYPAPCRVSLALAVVELFLTDVANVSLIVIVGYGLLARRIVVALIQTQMLRRGGSRFRPLDHHCLQRLGQQLRVMHVSRRHHRCQRASVSLHPQTALHPSFGAVGGIGADLIPPKRAFPKAASAACHCQSTPPSSSQAAIRVAQRRSINPSRIQRWKVRCTELSSG